MPGPLRHLLPRTLKRVVIVGGGPTGLFCADRLRHHFEVTVVDGKSYFEFTPSILRAAVDPSHHSQITFDYRSVLEKELGVEFVLGEATSVDASGGSGGALGKGAVHLAGAAGASRLNFDYCIVAVGASNGLWKPRLACEPPSGIASLLGEDRVGTAATLKATAAWAKKDAPEKTLDARRRSLQALRERLAASTGAVVVGAGLVGVELAAELVHFFPRLKVTLVDGAPDVLPQLGEGAREYARNWLQQHNVALRLGRPFRPESVKDDQVVLTCCGTRPRSAELFSDTSVLRRKGQIRVNRFMQVLHRADHEAAAAAAAAMAGSSLSSLTSLSSLSCPDIPLNRGRGRGVPAAGPGEDLRRGRCRGRGGNPNCSDDFPRGGDGRRGRGQH